MYESRGGSPEVDQMAEHVSGLAFHCKTLMIWFLDFCDRVSWSLSWPRTHYAAEAELFIFWPLPPNYLNLRL